MNNFAAWGLSILGIAVISTVAEMLLPHGKLKSVIRSVVASVVALTVVTPLPTLISSGFDLGALTEGSVQTDENYLGYVDGIRRGLIESAAEQFLEQNGYPGVKVEVKTDGAFSVVSAALDLQNSLISGADEHIHKSEIIGLAAEYLGIGEEAIMTYG